MANAKKRSESKTLMLLLIFISIFAGYMFYSQSKKGAALEIPPLPIRTKDNLSKIKDMSLDLSIFDNKTYKSLKIFGEAPVNPGVTGRTNIFAPI